MTRRIGLIGAGYIAGWHADAIRATKGLQLAAVCDRALGAAQSLAGAHGATAFGDLEAMIAANCCDAVHILTPPASHAAIAERALQAGLDVLVEKPVTLDLEELDALIATAAAQGRHLGVCHNFLALPSYGRLQQRLARGDLGMIAGLEVTWALPLPPLRSGPYGIWLLQQAKNLLLELGPHPFSLATDLLGPLQVEHVSLGQWIDLPGGGQRPQSWRILAKAGEVPVTLTLSVVETIEDRVVVVRGSSGVARLDYGADTLVVTQDNTAELVVNPLMKTLSQSGSYLRDGLRNAGRQAASLNQKSPYGLSFRGTIAAFYANPQDARFSAAAARPVMAAIEAALALADLPKDPQTPATRKPQPKVMVIGGTGFIGRALTRALVARGHDVRVVSRGAASPFPDLPDQVEVVPVALTDEAALVASMTGITCVFNLARSHDRSWSEALENDVGTALRISRAAKRAGVERMVYTGTIASYDMSNPKAVLTEATDFGPMESRNLYARSKAECEKQLLAAQASDGVPVVIARPGIVIGRGGPLQHWGIGRWHGAGAVMLWGKGHNILPFVLVEDVCAGLIAMMDRPAALGQSYNLIGEPMLTGRDYFAEIHKRLGAKLKVTGSDLRLLWRADQVKLALKRRVLRRQGLEEISLIDWQSRGHLARFDNTKAKTALDWRPQADREAFLIAAVDKARLFN